MADHLVDTSNEQLTSTLAGDSLVPLESILFTEELRRRPSRPPDHEMENRALTALVQALADSPSTILQTLADTILKVFDCDSAGISLLTEDEKNFQWAAIAGAWQPHLGGGTPRNFGPCGDVLDRNAPLLFKHWERRYPYLMEAKPLAEEGMLVPFYVSGKAMGTIWAITHDDRRQFDAEDLRQLECLARFASAAYLAATTVELKNQRRAALNLMEDAFESRRVVEALNVQLRESEERFRALFDSSPMAVFVCDRNAVIQSYNRCAVELWGREPECGVEKHCGSVSLWLPNGEILPHEQSPVLEVLRTGIPALNVEVFIERPDGSRIPVLVNFAALRNAEGEITGAITTFVDITERKLAEAVLRESETRYRELLNALPVAVYTTDAEGTITLFNEAATTFAGRRAQTGKDKWCVTHRLYRSDGSFLPHDACPMAVSLRTGVPQRGVEAMAERPDGTSAWFMPYPTLVRDASGAITGGINVLVDITERKQTEAALIKSEKLAAAGRLAAGLAHEINNPLQAVSNLMELLRRSTKIDAEDRVFAELAADELRRVTHLTRQSLSFYRETDSPIAIELEEVIAGILSLYGKQIAAKKIVVRTRYELGGARFDSYPGAIRQVLSTLLLNALEAVQENGAIAIRVRKCFNARRGAAVPSIRITMADNGAGIAPENLSRIFEPFFTTKGERGTGLGLWVAQGIVSGLGGAIRVRSSMRPGKSGTCFSISLPNEAPKKL